MIKKRKITDILLNVSRTVSSSLDLDKVSELVLKESMMMLNADHASLFLIDRHLHGKGSKRPMLTKAKGFSADEIDNLRLLGAWEIINEQLVTHKKGITVNNVEKNPIFNKKRLAFSREKLPVTSFLAVPLKKDGIVIGTLIVSNTKRHGRPFTRHDETLLTTLSYHIAIALSNAKLFEELSQAQAEAAQSEKMAVIGTLSAGINHEIANPLSIAQMRCSAFLSALKEDSYKNRSHGDLLEEAKGIMAKVTQEIARAAAIAARLSNFAKPAKGTAEDVDIEKSVDEILGLVGYELRLENIKIAKNIEKGLPVVRVDRKQFEEVLFNLIRNAAQAMKGRGEIRITAGLDSGKVFVDIMDTGPGIPPEIKKQLFKPFFTTKEPGKGTGLGLFIVRKVIEKNGGRVYIKNTKVGSGTTFTLEFPLRQSLA